MDVLDHLLGAVPSGPSANLAAYLERASTCPFARPFDRALWAGFEADRLGYAFTAGYHAALAALLRTPPSERLSLAATEAGGGHPRAIETRLEGNRLHGEKTFATLASVAHGILVVASRGEKQNGRNQLCVVRVSPTARGLTIVDRPPTPFAPEVSHARLTFDRVEIADGDVLPGDGYDTYLKPFRTLEDTHVLAATLGHLIGCGRTFGFARLMTESALAIVSGLRTVAEHPSSPHAHLALAGLFTAVRRLVAEHDAEWNQVDAEPRERWHRDLALLMVAEQVRHKRTAAAWQAVRPTNEHTSGEIER